LTAHPAISTRAAAITPSATLAVSNRAGELRAEGKHVLNFSAGEPDFKPPTAVRERVAACSRDEAQRYAPVPGTVTLRNAVAAELAAYHRRAISPSDVLVSCGAKHSLANLFLATLNPGDQVVIPAPYWVSYPDMVGLAEGTAVIANTTAASGFVLTPEGLEAVLGPQTRYVILNSPSNPTGAGYSAAQVRALGELLARKAPQAWLLCDDIYRKLVYGDHVHVSAFAALEGITDQVILVDGVSKTYAMTGYRIGYMVAPKHVVAAASAIQSQMTSGACTIAQRAAEVALTDPTVEAEVAQMHAAFTRRRKLMLAGLAVVPGCSVFPPNGAFYVFADVSAHIGRHTKFSDDVELATWLLEEKLVATVPGTPFGAPGYLRLSYATDDATIQDGCARITAALASLPVA
jgi:aspartate aminotransferase